MLIILWRQDDFAVSKRHSIYDIAYGNIISTGGREISLHLDKILEVNNKAAVKSNIFVNIQPNGLTKCFFGTIIMPMNKYSFKEEDLARILLKYES